MAISTQFISAQRLFAEISGCPMGNGVPPDEAQACQHCPYNLAFSGQARPGCQVRTPPEIYEQARRALALRDKSLSAEFNDLVSTHQRVELSDPAVQRWQSLAMRWFDLLSERDESEREVCMTVARFARAVDQLGEGVVILS